MSVPKEHQTDSASEHFRLFIALPVPEMVKDELRRAQNDLRLGLGSGAVRWTRPEQIHLTLKFLGNVASSDVKNLIEASAPACCAFAPIQLEVRGIGFFPSVRRPRVVWAEIREEGEQLRQLQLAISGASAGFTTESDDKEFAAHLTLGRVRTLSRDETRLLGEAARRMSERNFGEWMADRVEIVRSELDAEGSRHSCMAEIALGISGKSH